MDKKKKDMKQTAVEWLVEKIQQANPTFKFDALIRESKEMEKEQKGYSEEDMKKAFKVGFSNGFASDILSTEKLQKEKERLFCDWFEQFKNK